MKIFVGNLSGGTTEDELRQAFESFGQVRSVTIAMDPATGKSRRFGFVVMPSVSEAQNAIEKMNGKDLGGQKIKVEKSRTNAKARSSRRKRSSSGARGRADGGQGVILAVVVAGVATDNRYRLTPFRSRGQQK